MASPPPPPRRPLPQPIEETHTSHRSSKESKASASASASEAARAGKPPSSPTSPIKPRRALPQPVESSSKSSRKGASKQDISDTSRDFIGETSGNPRVLPQPIESLGSSNAHSSPSQSSKPARKFAPQVIETSRRSRRNTSSESDSSDLTPLASRPHSISSIDSLHHPQRTPSGAEHTAVPDLQSYTAPPPESRFSSSKLAERTARRHSFRVPDLVAIPSITESNDSSASDEDSDSKGQKRRREHHQTSQTRESQDETTSGYLLSLAAQAAQKQLKEQVLAAYPNENLHEPVDHYAGDRDSDGEGESGVKSSMGKTAGIQGGPGRKERDQKSRRQRRDSDSDEAGDLAELRKHGAKVEQQKRDVWNSQPQEPAQPPISYSNIGASDPNAEFRRRAAPTGLKPAPAQPSANNNRHAANELKSMAKAASPPMAGQDLLFPRCASPNNTPRLDVHQYPGHGLSSTPASRQQTGLWTPKNDLSRENSKSGLWMGVNAASAQDHLAPPHFVSTGLITPAVETGDPFSSAENSVAPSRRSSYVAAPSLPPSPPSSQEEAELLQHRHHAVKKPRIVTTEVLTLIEEELNDAFVTQVYNYLSLGYPSLARPYDEELAKIAQMDVKMLRKDDLDANSKGYVGAPEGTGMDVRGCREGACQRWVALKRYVLEWGRQQALVKGVGGAEWEKSESVGDQGGWGARARKGSWAI